MAIMLSPFPSEPTFPYYLTFPSTPGNPISVSGFKVIICQEMGEQRKSACANKRSELYNIFKEIWLYFDNTVLWREETELCKLVILNKKKGRFKMSRSLLEDESDY